MTRKCITIVLTLCMILSAYVCTFAEEPGTDPTPRVIETSDGVLSIAAPSETWEVTADPNYWFAMTDGMNTITIEHLTNGESLPAVAVADETYEAVYQAFVSTRNEVFVVKGSAVRAEALESIMRSIGTIKILQFNTKTAINKDAPAASTLSIKPIDKTYYVIGDSVNIRLGCSIDDQAIGSKDYGEEVHVIGAVQKDGVDLGWYQISFNNATGYVSAAFLSETKPQGNSAKSSAGSSGNGNYALDSANGTQDPLGETVIDSVNGTQDPLAETVIDSVNGTQDPLAETVIDSVNGTQDPLAETVIDSVNGTQDPLAEVVIDSVNGTQDPAA